MLLQFLDAHGRPVAFDPKAVTYIYDDPERVGKRTFVRLLTGIMYAVSVDRERIEAMMANDGVRLVRITPPEVRRGTVPMFVNPGHVIAIDTRPGSGGHIDLLRRYLVFSDGEVVDTSLEFHHLAAALAIK